MLRSDLGLVGTRFGCGAGLCGACTGVVDNDAVRSCSTAFRDVAGREVLTIERLSREGSLHPLQQAFLEHNAFQCGYCTSGTILNAYVLARGWQTPAERREKNLGELSLAAACGGEVTRWGLRRKKVS